MRYCHGYAMPNQSDIVEKTNEIIDIINKKENEK